MEGACRRVAMDLTVKEGKRRQKTLKGEGQ